MDEFTRSVVDRADFNFKQVMELGISGSFNHEHAFEVFIAELVKLDVIKNLTASNLSRARGYLEFIDDREQSINVENCLAIFGISIYEGTGKKVKANIISAIAKARTFLGKVEDNRKKAGKEGLRQLSEERRAKGTDKDVVLI